MMEAAQKDEDNLQRLCEKFTRDILYGCQSVHARFDHSQAQKDIVQEGQSALPHIVAYLQNNLPNKGMDLCIAWGKLLREIEDEIDEEKSGPQDLRDMPGWIVWAEKFSGGGTQ